MVGYPAFDPRNDTAVQNTVFGGFYYVKRLQPGKLQKRGAIDSFGKSVSAATHDSSTLGGNSGSALVDPATGQVVGLHFAGVYLEANYAVPTAELARDPRVIDAGLRFEPGPHPKRTYGTSGGETPTARRNRRKDGRRLETTAVRGRRQVARRRRKVRSRSALRMEALRGRSRWRLPFAWEARPVPHAPTRRRRRRSTLPRRWPSPSMTATTRRGQDMTVRFSGCRCRFPSRPTTRSPPAWTTATTSSPIITSRS